MRWLNPRPNKSLYPVLKLLHIECTYCKYRINILLERQGVCAFFQNTASLYFKLKMNSALKKLAFVFKKKFSMKFARVKSIPTILYLSFWGFTVFIKACSHCAIATAISLIATNGLYRTRWRCSYYATATTSPAPMQPIVSKDKSQS